MNISRSTFLIPTIFIFYFYLTVKMLAPVSLSALVTVIFAGFYFGTCMNQCKKTQVEEWIKRCLSGKLKQAFISHRGESGLYPENTLAAFKEAIRKGATAIEVDLRLSKDGHIERLIFSVRIINESVRRSIERCTNGSGKVCDFTFDQLKLLKTKMSDGRLTDEPIASLIEVIGLCTENDTLIILDIKDGSMAAVVD
ncbi:hypothetical protein ACOME3_000818 [Neoechinorhynchus agilis]